MVQSNSWSKLSGRVRLTFVTNLIKHKDALDAIMFTLHQSLPLLLHHRLFSCSSWFCFDVFCFFFHLLFISHTMRSQNKSIFSLFTSMLFLSSAFKSYNPTPLCCWLFTLVVSNSIATENRIYVICNAPIPIDDISACTSKGMIWSVMTTPCHWEYEQKMKKIKLRPHEERTQGPYKSNRLTSVLLRFFGKESIQNNVRERTQKEQRHCLEISRFSLYIHAHSNDCFCDGQITVSHE